MTPCYQVHTACGTVQFHMLQSAETENVLNRAEHCVQFAQLSTVVHAASHKSICSMDVDTCVWYADSHVSPCVYDIVWYSMMLYAFIQTHAVLSFAIHLSIHMERFVWTQMN